MTLLLVAQDARGLPNTNADTQAPVMSATPPTSSSVTTTTATASWSAATDDVAVTIYTLYDATSGSPVFIDTTLVGVRTYNLTGLAPGQDNTIWITASDAAGNESDPSILTITTTAAVDTTAPSIPVNLGLDTFNDTQVVFHSDASTDDLSGVSHYRILDGGVFVANSVDETPSFTVSGLTPGSSHVYTLESVDNAGNTSAASSGAGGSVSVTTTSTGTSVSVRGSATGKTTAGANPTVVIPATIRTSDIMLIWVSTANGETQAVPSGWTAVTAPITNGTMEGSLIKRTAAGTAGQVSTDAGTTVTVVVSASQKNTLYFVAWYNEDGTTPLNVVQAVAESASTASHALPSATSTVAGCAQVGAIAWRDGTSGTASITPPSGWTSPAGIVSTGGANGNGMYVAVNPTPVAAGAQAGTFLADQPTQRAVMWNICLAPVTAGGGPAPAQVTNLHTTSITQTAIGLDHDATSGTGITYNLYWNDPVNNPGNTTANVVYRTGIIGTPFTVTGLTASTTYAFATAAVNSASLEGPKSGTIRPKTSDPTGGGSGGPGILFMLQGTNQKAQSGPNAGQSSLTKLGDRTPANGWVTGSGGFLVDPSGQAVNLGGVRGYYTAGNFPTAFDPTFATGGSGVNTNKRQQMCFKGGSGWTNFADWITRAIDVPWCRWLNSIPNGWEIEATPHHEPQDDFDTGSNTTAQFKAGLMRFAALLENRPMPAGQPTKDPAAATVNLKPGVLVYMAVCFTVPPSASANKWPTMKDALPLASQLDANSKVCVDAYQNPPPPVTGSTYPTGKQVLGYFLDNILHAYGYDAAGHGWTIGEWMCPQRTGNPAGQTAAVNEYLSYCENRTVPAGWGPAGGPPYAIRMWEDRFGEVDGSNAKFDQTALPATKAAFVSHALGANART